MFWKNKAYYTPCQLTPIDTNNYCYLHAGYTANQKASECTAVLPEYDENNTTHFDELIKSSALYARRQNALFAFQMWHNMTRSALELKQINTYQRELEKKIASIHGLLQDIQDKATGDDASGTPEEMMMLKNIDTKMQILHSANKNLKDKFTQLQSKHDVLNSTKQSLEDELKNLEKKIEALNIEKTNLTTFLKDQRQIFRTGFSKLLGIQEELLGSNTAMKQHIQKLRNQLVSHVSHQNIKSQDIGPDVGELEKKNNNRQQMEKFQMLSFKIFQTIITQLDPTRPVEISHDVKDEDEVKEFIKYWAKHIGKDDIYYIKPQPDSDKWEIVSVTQKRSTEISQKKSHNIMFVSIPPGKGHPNENVRQKYPANVYVTLSLQNSPGKLDAEEPEVQEITAIPV